jgi:hypothetical protein
MTDVDREGEGGAALLLSSFLKREEENREWLKGDPYFCGERMN